MKILAFGRGVISTQYAWAFEKAGHTVAFYVRPGRKAEFGATVALNILDARKKISGVVAKEDWPVTIIEDFNANHDYDLIFVSVQHYQFQSAAAFLADKVGQATVLVFSNCWEEPKVAVAKLPENQVVWGFPGAGGGFDNTGVLNGALFDGVKIGTFGNELTSRDKEVIALFKSADIKPKEQKDFRSYLFSHFVLNAAMHFEGLKSGKGIAALKDLQTTKFWQNVILNGKELLPLLKARNVDLKASSEIKLLSLPPWLLSALMRATMKFLPPFKRVFTGHSNHYELQSYCRDVLSKAEEFKISLPRYEENKKIFLDP